MMNEYEIPVAGRSVVEYQNYIISLPWVWTAGAMRSVTIDHSDFVVADATLDLTDYPDIIYIGPFVAVPTLLSTILTRYAFLQRFTDAEMEGILAAASVSPAINLYLYKLNIATEVDLANTDIINGLHGLEAGGLLGAGRANQILGVI